MFYSYLFNRIISLSFKFKAINTSFYPIFFINKSEKTNEIHRDSLCACMQWTVLLCVVCLASIQSKLHNRLFVQTEYKNRQNFSLTKFSNKKPKRPIESNTNKSKTSKPTMNRWNTATPTKEETEFIYRNEKMNEANSR